jgi:hypothetical protein
MVAAFAICFVVGLIVGLPHYGSRASISRS